MAVFKSSPVSTGLERAGRQQGGHGQETQSTERPRLSLVGRIRITRTARRAALLLDTAETEARCANNRAIKTPQKKTKNINTQEFYYCRILSFHTVTVFCKKKL
jgi:hypothetical protein